jgi:hypothetical protein
MLEDHGSPRGIQVAIRAAIHALLHGRAPGGSQRERLPSHRCWECATRRTRTERDEPLGSPLQPHTAYGLFRRVKSSDSVKRDVLTAPHARNCTRFMARRGPPFYTPKRVKLSKSLHFPNVAQVQVLPLVCTWPG